MRGSLREKRAGVWELRVYVGTDPLTGRRRQQSKTFRGTRRQAEVALAELVAQVAHDRPDPAEASTVRQLAADWLAAIERQRATLTVQGYRSIVDRYIVPALGARKVSAVSVRDLDRYFDALADQGLAASTMNQHRAVLAGMFKLARRWGLVVKDPMVDVPRRHGTKGERDAVPPELAPLLFDTAVRTNPTMATLLRVAAVTGARRGELCGLQWGDLDGRRLTVRRAVVKPTGGAVEVKDTKSHQVRRVTLDAETVAVLEDHRATCERRARACGVRLGPWMFSTDAACRVPMTPGTVAGSLFGGRRTANGG